MSGERTPEHFAQDNDPRWRKVAGLLRRMVVRFSAQGIWELAGFSTLKEVVRSEGFQGLGFWARPPSGVTVEAIVVSIGGSDHPVVVALRDETTRRAVANALLADESIQYNSSVRVHAKANGTVEVRAHGGVALPLATKADIDALRTYVAAHIHSGVTTGGGVSGTPSVSPPDAVGTTVLKGE